MTPTVTVTVAVSLDLTLTLTLALTRCLHKMLETLANDMPAQQRHSRCRGASRQRHSSLRRPPWAGASGA